MECFQSPCHVAATGFSRVFRARRMTKRSGSADRNRRPLRIWMDGQQRRAAAREAATAADTAAAPELEVRGEPVACVTARRSSRPLHQNTGK